MEENETFVDKITDWWWRNIGWKIVDIYRSIKNIIRWFPIIWKDRDWDGSYIYTILQTKLKFQSKYIGNRNFHTSAKRDFEIMNLCVNLIEKINIEYYGMEYMDYSQTEYKFIDSDKPGFKEMVINDISENFDEYFKKYPLIHRKVLNGEGVFPIIDPDTNEVNKRRIAMNIANINESRVRKLLFKILKEHIDGWWE